MSNSFTHATKSTSGRNDLHKQRLTPPTLNIYKQDMLECWLGDSIQVTVLFTRSTNAIRRNDFSSSSNVLKYTTKHQMSLKVIHH